MNVISHKLVKSRKSHQCFSCLRKIPAHTPIYAWAVVYEGDFGHGHTCTTCQDIMDIQGSDDGEGFPEEFVREQLNKDQIPEDLLIELKEK